MRLRPWPWPASEGSESSLHSHGHDYIFFSTRSRASSHLPVATGRRWLLDAPGPMTSSRSPIACNSAINPRKKDEVEGLEYRTCSGLRLFALHVARIQFQEYTNSR